MKQYMIEVIFTGGLIKLYRIKAETYWEAMTKLAPGNDAMKVTIWE